MGSTIFANVDLPGRTAKAVQLVPDELFDAFLRQKRWSAERLATGFYRDAKGKPINLENVLLYIIAAKPSLWIERNLVWPDSGEPRTLWPHQERLMNYHGNIVAQCGAGVGKTSEIACRTIWRAGFWGRNILIGAAFDGQLELIWDELIYQLKRNPWLRSIIDWKATTRRPYRKIVLVRGRRVNYIHLRPAGIWGESWRGVHVDDAYMDEAALIRNEKTWGNYFRAIATGGEARIYSTPNGDKSTVFYRLTQKATPFEPFIAENPQFLDPFFYPVPGQSNALREKWTAVKAQQPTYLLVRWSKLDEEIPEIHRSAQRIAQWTADYGGPGNQDWETQVKGEHGDIADSVFPYDLLKHGLKYIPAYRHIHIRRENAIEHVLTVTKLNRDYRLTGKLGDDSERDSLSDVLPVGDADAMKLRLPERAGNSLVDPDRIDWWEDEIGRWLHPEHSRNGDTSIAGVDIGWTRDPTSINLARIDDFGRMHWTLRVSLHGFNDEHAQAEVICALENLLHPTKGWSIDATSRGKTIAAALRGVTWGSYHWRNRLSAVDFASFVNDRDPETGRYIFKEDEPEEHQRAPAKDLATRIVGVWLRKRKIVFPLSSDIVQEWTNYRVRKIGAKGFPVYSDNNDHTIAAWLTLALRLFLNEHELASVPTVITAGDDASDEDFL